MRLPRCFQLSCMCSCYGVVGCQHVAECSNAQDSHHQLCFCSGGRTGVSCLLRDLVGFGPVAGCWQKLGMRSHIVEGGRQALPAFICTHQALCVLRVEAIPLGSGGALARVLHACFLCVVLWYELRLLQFLIQSLVVSSPFRGRSWSAACACSVVPPSGAQGVARRLRQHAAWL